LRSESDKKQRKKEKLSEAPERELSINTSELSGVGELGMRSVRSHW